MTEQDTQKIDEALALLNEIARDKKEELKQSMSDKYGDLKSTVLDMESEVADTARESAERLNAFKKSAEQHLRNTASDLERKVQNEPLKALGWSVAGAFVIGYILGSKD